MKKNDATISGLGPGRRREVRAASRDEGAGGAQEQASDRSERLPVVRVVSLVLAVAATSDLCERVRSCVHSRSAVLPYLNVLSVHYLRCSM